jgi:large subunit ribosomal protein L25
LGLSGYSALTLVNISIAWVYDLIIDTKWLETLRSVNMIDTNLKAMERSEKPNVVRREGFTPGVLNGPGTASSTVKFDSVALNKIISKHGSNAKIWVELGAEKKFGFIKEIQKHPVEGKISHVAIQIVAENQEIKMVLPINFHGGIELEHKLMKMQIYKPEVEVLGRPALMPDSIVVDVSDRVDGGNITAADLNMPQDLKILDAEDAIYAVIRALRETVPEKA